MEEPPANAIPAAFAAVDLGAESGRVMRGTVTAGGITLEEVHRWPSRRVRVFGSERWDVLFMWGEILNGLSRVGKVASVSVDSWGVDYAYVAGGQPFTSPPFMYRDTRTADAYARVAGSADDRRAIYAATGVQFMPINTVYQMASDTPADRARADGFLLIADFFHYLLTGVVAQERSLASTTQLYDPDRRAWSDDVIGLAGLDRRLFPRLIAAGETVGPILDDVAAVTGLRRGTPVVATCSHDTGNAVAATPAADGAAFLSSGTWSLMGIELETPVMTNEALAADFTNEVGYGHTIRFLRNLSGLFPVQECRREFGDVTYEQLADEAAAAEGARSLVRLDLPQFGTPGGMGDKLRGFCRDTGQPEPSTPGQTVRCCYDSLALLYAETRDALEHVTGRAVTSVAVAGGGSRATLLNQLASDACGVPVTAGPAEATAMGNVGLQAVAAGVLPDVAAVRQRVAASSPPTRYAPAGGLADHRRRFDALRHTTA